MAETRNVTMPSRIRKLARPIPKAAPLQIRPLPTVRPAIRRVNSSSIRNAACPTPRKTILGNSRTGLHTRQVRRHAAWRTPRNVILGNSRTGLLTRRPRRNGACLTTRKTILASSLAGLRIQARHNTITWRARSPVRRTSSTRNPAPRSTRAPRTLRRKLRVARTRPRNNMRLRRTPGHRLQVGLVSKAFRSEPRRRVSRTLSHPLPAPTTEGITVAAADG